MERVPATAALAVSCTTPWATPSWISGSGALATPSASKLRGRVEAKRGESDRFTAGRGHAGPEPSHQRALALGVQQPVERAAAEQLQQLAHGGGLEHDRVAAGLELGRLGLHRGQLGGALGQRRRVEVADRHRGARGVAAALRWGRCRPPS